jgi:aspartokinase-like uncharacterized kinase
MHDRPTTNLDRDLIHLVKLGGSLLDWPGLRDRFETLRTTELSRRTAVLVGGGDAADHVRRFDRTHGLGPELGHWMAVRAMQLNAHLTYSILPRCALVTEAAACKSAWSEQRIAIIDPIAWLEMEESRGVKTPHRWSFTSDSIAAHLAKQLQAPRLTLLKSTLPPEAGCNIEQAAAVGIVDADFPAASQGIPCIELINLRATPPRRYVIR